MTPRLSLLLILLFHLQNTQQQLQDSSLCNIIADHCIEHMAFRSTPVRTPKLIQSAQKNSQWGGFMAVIDPQYKLMDPFIFLVHHVHSFRPGEVTGFPAHPHRGFQTVTYAIEGGFNHEDSKGNKGTYSNGDVQWMSAGSGVLHSEMFITKKDQPSTFNGFQLWLNLPQKLKMSEPSYHMAWKDEIPQITLVPVQEEKPDSNSQVEGGNAQIKILAGRVNEKKSQIETTTPLSFLHVKLDPKSTWTYQVPSAHNCFMYVLEGSGAIGREEQEQPLKNQQYVVFENDGEQVRIKNTHETSVLDFLILEGQPYNEPFAHQGPFVMNTKQELQQAFADYYSGKFGKMRDDYEYDY